MPFNLLLPNNKTRAVPGFFVVGIGHASFFRDDKGFFRFALERGEEERAF